MELELGVGKNRKKMRKSSRSWEAELGVGVKKTGRPKSESEVGVEKTGTPDSKSGSESKNFEGLGRNWVSESNEIYDCAPLG